MHNDSLILLELLSEVDSNFEHSFFLEEKEKSELFKKFEIWVQKEDKCPVCTSNKKQYIWYEFGKKKTDSKPPTSDWYEVFEHCGNCDFPLTFYPDSGQPSEYYKEYVIFRVFIALLKNYKVDRYENKIVYSKDNISITITFDYRIQIQGGKADIVLPIFMLNPELLQLIFLNSLTHE